MIGLKGFHETWLTVGHHRVHIYVRDGFPQERDEQLTRTVAAACSSWSSHLRLVRLMVDSTRDHHHFLLASTEADDEQKAADIRAGLDYLFGSGSYEVQFVLVPDGEQWSEYTDHMARLAEFCEVAS